MRLVATVGGFVVPPSGDIVSVLGTVDVVSPAGGAGVFGTDFSSVESAMVI